MKVNSFIVGWPKTGSTSLYDYLSQHPDIFVSKNKDTYYFCNDLRQSSIDFHGENKYNFISTIEEYESLFDEYTSEKVICEASVFYTISKVAAKNIFNYNPASKIIILLREPKALMNSWYNYQKSHSRETATTFNEAINLEETRKKDTSLIPDITYMPSHVYYKSLVKFDEGIERFYKYFKSENIKIIFTKDLEENGLKTVQDIYSFLKIDNLFIPDLRKKNITVNTKNTFLNGVVDNTLRPLKLTVKKIMSANMHSKIKKMYSFVFFNKEIANKNINLNLEKDLDDFLLPMIKNTEELIKVDLLKKWNYKDNE